MSDLYMANKLARDEYEMQAAAHMREDQTFNDMLPENDNRWLSGAEPRQGNGIVALFLGGALRIADKFRSSRDARPVVVDGQCTELG